MLDYSIPIPKEYWNPTEGGSIVRDSFKGRKLCVYLPKGYSPEERYDIFYFKMGTNNSAEQFWTYPRYTSHFENVIDHLIEEGEIRPCVIVSIDGEAPNGSWLPVNAYDLICYVEGRITTYAEKDATKIMASRDHRAIGGWSLGAIECRTMLVNAKKNDYYKVFGKWDIQSGYNADGMAGIDPSVFVGCAAGSRDAVGCVTFTRNCQGIFKKTPALQKNHAQIVPGYTHAIGYQLAYFYNAIRYFFPGNA